ncbi:hypothetical protein BDP81DRAFT_472990 [Colletotrichum phormii]|uniref:Uncharacterized protein n=1 Tax=Colletotrichum phormii TaxID=359342 RepID=A0AAI9ZMH2_9PEZI|nr:uncharacterized protein BDP81DRAFT_472990 [Colletotrichum phormii]KAK1634711.1 hypothetical protein BDP81DRAFT_472990 [Colletotrichum phormii]
MRLLLLLLLLLLLVIITLLPPSIHLPTQSTKLPLTPTKPQVETAVETSDLSLWLFILRILDNLPILFAPRLLLVASTLRRGTGAGAGSLLGRRLLLCIPTVSRMVSLEKQSRQEE